MEFIEQLIDDFYQVANLNGSGKRPGIKDWNTIPNLYDYCKLNIKRFFIRTGDQFCEFNINGGECDDHVIGLDFDVFKATCKNQQHKKTLELLKEFKTINEGNHGMFESATAFNEGCLVSIKDCMDIRELLRDIGKTTFKNKGFELEILNGSAMVLPPTATQCKMTKRENARKFYDEENPMLKLKRNTPQHKFILNYIKTYWNNNSGMTANTKNRLNKTQKAIYKNLSNGKYNDEIKNNPIHGVELLCKLNKERFEYQQWWKIGVALLNSFPKEVAQTLFIGWSKKDPNFDSEEDVIEKLESFDKLRERYNGLNMPWIFRLIERDCKGEFLPIIQEYKEIVRDTLKVGYKEKFESEYKFCMNPQGYYHRSKDNIWIMKNSAQISELEAHNAELLGEWRTNPKRKIYKWADSIPVKNHEDGNVLNLFGGFKFWDWGDMEEWEEEWCEKQSKYEREGEENNVLLACQEWWTKYIDVISGGNEKIGIYIKALIGRSLFDPTVPSRVMICHSGKHGSGKSFVGNLMDALLGKEAVHSETNAEQGNSVFGGFQEPLLTATQVFLEENDPKQLNKIISILKDYITKDRYKINTKGKNLISRLNCIQFWANSNDLSTIDFETTVRRFLAVKVLPDLIKGLIGDLDKYWIEKFGYKFWTFGYDMMLKEDFCLKYIVLDIHDTYEEYARKFHVLPEDIDFQTSMPECDHMTHAIKKNIKPIYPYIQNICREALDICFEYDSLEDKKSFDYWYFREKKPDSVLIPVPSKLAVKIGFAGGWRIPIKAFRVGLEAYMRDTLDLGNNLNWDTKKIKEYLVDLLNYKDGETNLIEQSYNGENCYIIKPEKTMEILKIFGFYQKEFISIGKEAIVENDEDFDWGE